jgi:hypothetical protein
MCVQWHGTKCTPGITPGPGETSRRVERGDPDWTVSNSRKYLLTGNREPGSRDHQTAGRPPIGNRCGSWTIPAREYSGASTPMPLPPPPAVSPPSPRFLRPVGGGVLGRLSLAPWGSGIAIRWTGTPPGQPGRHTRGTSNRQVPQWATLGRGRSTRGRAACSQPAGRIVAGQSSGVRAGIAARAAQVASLRAVARRER